MLKSKILTILATAAWLLAACAGNEDEPASQPTPQPQPAPSVGPEIGDVPINFSALVADHAVTRTDVTPVYGDGADKTGYTDIAQLKNDQNPDGFGVFAFYTGNSTFSTAKTSEYNYERQLLMNNQKVTSTDGKTWTYAPLRVWPANDAKISFFAYAPYVSYNTEAEISLGSDQYANTHDGAEGYKFFN